MPEPIEINGILGDLYGRNNFGGGLYRMVWGQSEAMQVRGPEGRYTEMLVGHNKPCWLLQRWCDPSMFWTPDLYYAMSADESGLSLTGEYPQFGRYDTIITFLEHEVIDDELVITTIPLNVEILRLLIPVLQKASELTAEEMRRTAAALDAKKNAEKCEAIAERLEENMFAFYNPVSFAGHRSNVNSAFQQVVEKKKKQIEAEWAKRRIFERRPSGSRGMFQ